jgi:hypothetical protein
VCVAVGIVEFPVTVTEVTLLVVDAVVISEHFVHVTVVETVVKLVTGVEVGEVEVIEVGVEVGVDEVGVEVGVDEVGVEVGVSVVEVAVRDTELDENGGPAQKPPTQPL